MKEQNKNYIGKIIKVQVPQVYTSYNSSDAILLTLEGKVIEETGEKLRLADVKSFYKGKTTFEAKEITFYKKEIERILE